MALNPLLEAYTSEYHINPTRDPRYGFFLGVFETLKVLALFVQKKPQNQVAPRFATAVFGARVTRQRDDQPGARNSNT